MLATSALKQVCADDGNYWVALSYNKAVYRNIRQSDLRAMRYSTVPYDGDGDVEYEVTKAFPSC